MGGLTNSNQDHSAPFHGYYSEQSLKNDGRQRAAYWNTILSGSIGYLIDLNDYTGLKNEINNLTQ